MRPIETIKLSQKAKDQLIRLKRLTKLTQWNVLCRWAFCTSLAEASVPPKTKVALDSSVEMTWKVFGGQYEELYAALLKQRCVIDGLKTNQETLAEQFKLHLHRGIGYLAADRNVKTISGLIGKIPLPHSPNARP